MSILIDMEIIRRQYYRFLIAFMIFLCAFCVGLSFWAILQAEKIHARQTYEQIYAIQKNLLHDTVQNMLRDIDRLRAENRKNAIENIQWLATDIRRLYELAPKDFVVDVTEFLTHSEYTDSLNILLEDKANRLVMHQSGLSSYSSVSAFGPYRLSLGTNESWVDSQTKASVADIIHNQKFENEGYIWVNEIKNWNGGDDYAIRRIHPNLIETEGTYLSTKTKDIKGNTPYLTELEGVKNSGEVFSTYYFKRNGSDEIAEKLSYATLYKDYDWIVAMGVYLADVQVYIDAAQKASQILMAKVLITALAIILLLFVIGLYILFRLEKWYTARNFHAFRVESNTDHLTGALNRRMGDEYIRESLKRFHRGLDDPLFYFIDIDNFKKVNDTYGHEAGDLVLKAIVKKIGENMRSSDNLFRWGGEEFLLMCFGVERSGASALADKFNKTIARTPIVIGKSQLPPTCNLNLESCEFGVCEKKGRFNDECINRDGESIIHVSVSIGITCFNKLDVTPEIAINRADKAMYEAKVAGKNCARELY